MHRGRLFCCRLARLHSMVMTCDLAGGVSDEMIDDLLVGDWVQSDICLLLLLLTHALLTNIIIPIMLKLVALSLLLAALTALEVRIITNDLPILHGSSRVEEVNPLKLTINSNGKYIYPHHQNTFKLYPIFHSDHNCQSAEASFRLFPPITYTLSSWLTKSQLGKTQSTSFTRSPVTSFKGLANPST